jgi:outer membrane protein W
MNNRDLDMFQKLNNYPSPTDLDKIWAGIEPSLPKADQRKPLAWLPWAFLGLLLLGGAYLVWTSSIENANEPKLPEVATKNTAAASAPNIEKQKIPVEIVQLSPTAGTNTSKKGHAKPINMPAKAEKLVSAPSVLAQTLAFDNVATMHPSGPLALETVSDDQFKGYQSSLASTTQSIEVLASLPMRSIKLPIPMIAPDFNRPDPQTGCYDWSGRKGRLRPYVGVYGGAHIPLRSIEAKTTEFTQWAAARNATETRLEAVNLGAFFGLQAKNGLSIDAGIDYMRINERFKASDTTTTVIGQIVTTGFIVNAPGDTTFITESVDITETTVNTRTTYNRYSFVSIPIGVGYTFNQKNAVKPYVKAGAQFNLSTRQKVGMLDASGQYQLYNSSNTSASTYPFRAQIGVMPFVQVGASVALTGAFEAFGEVRYLHMLRDVTNDSFPLNQRYSTVGVQLGLRLRL